MRNYMKKIWLLLPTSLVIILTFQNCDLTRNVTPDTSRSLDIGAMQSITRVYDNAVGEQKDYSVNVTLGATTTLFYTFNDQHNHCSATVSFSDTEKALLENVLDYIRYVDAEGAPSNVMESQKQQVIFQGLNDDLHIYDQAYHLGQSLLVFSQGRDELMLFLKNKVRSQDVHMCPSDLDILFN
jgi:hypothetical protein